jgi:hypothetical protein
MLHIALGADVRAFSIQRSKARDGYFNFSFESPNASRVWRAVRGRALGHRAFGRALRHSTIIVSQGSRGWNNYGLLHHYDLRKTLDTLAGR